MELITRMNLVGKICASIYAVGVLTHTGWSANRGGTLEVQLFKEASGTGQEVSYFSSFQAFWSGAKWNVFWTFLDAIIWPVEVTAFVVYLTHMYRHRIVE